MQFKPMKAEAADLSRLRFPLLVSPKLDGVRAVNLDGQLVSNTLKKFPNELVYAKLASSAPLDGELICGDPTSPTVFRDTMKCVMSHTFPVDELRYYVFDVVGTSEFKDRLSVSKTYCDGSQIVSVPHVLVTSLDELTEMEENALLNGYEGLMVRDPAGRYKYGRSTVAEGALLKVKRNLQSEAIITGFEEQMHNANEAKVDNLGHTERSSHKANMVPTGVLGALVVRDVISGVEFNIGTGFTYQDREEIWRKRHEWIGQMVTYKYLPVGVKDKPRHPVFLGLRPEGA